MAIERYETIAVLDESGRLELENERDYRANMKLMRPGRKALVVEDLKDTRSQRANRYYFGAVLRPLSEYTGSEVDELHEYFKQTLLAGEKKHIELADENGEVRFMGDVQVVSTKKMTVSDFYRYVERVRQVCAELGVVTEDPPERGE